MPVTEVKIKITQNRDILANVFEKITLHVKTPFQMLYSSYRSVVLMIVYETRRTDNYGRHEEQIITAFLKLVEMSRKKIHLQNLHN